MGYGDDYNPTQYGGGDDAATGTKRSSGGSIMSGGGSWGINPNGDDLIWQNPSPGFSGRGGGGGGSSGGTKTTTRRTVYAGAAPTMGALPTLTMPKVDKRRIRALTQEISAPAVRKLREGLQSSMNISSDNPNVRRMTLREALQGYGTGLESAMAGSGGQARAEHQQELNLLATEAQANYKTQVEKIAAEYNNAYNAYLKSGTETTTTTEGPAAEGRRLVRTPGGSLDWA